MVDKAKAAQVAAIIKEYLPMARPETLDEIAERIVATLANQDGKQAIRA